MRGSPNDQTSGRNASDQVPLWRAAGSVRLLVIGSMCIFPIVAVFIILQGTLPLPQWLNAILIRLAGWMLLAAIASFLLTPVAMVAGLWSIFKSNIDKRIKVAIACFLIAQMAAVLILLVSLWMTGGRFPH